MSMRRTIRFLGLVASVVGLAGVACSAKDDASVLRSKSSPIVHGVADTTDTFVVGIGIDLGGGYGAECSGAMIEPNLVLTARHCVSKTPEAIDCSATSNITANYATNQFYVSTNQDYQRGPQWAVRSIYYVNDATCAAGATNPECALCGNDLALIELRAGSSGFPSKWVAPTLVAPVAGNYRGIGYGCQDGPCSISGYRMLLDPLQVATVLSQDMIVRAGEVCQGDSGSPIYDATTNTILGILSRGEASCGRATYTRIDKHIDWLQKYGAIAAKNGGYAAAPWVTATKPSPPPPPTPQPMGAPCSSPADCETGVCVAVGSDQKCSKACGPTSHCPSGFSCDSGYCWPTAPTPADDAGPATDDATPPVDDAAPLDDTAPPTSNPDQTDSATTSKGGCSVPHGGGGDSGPRPIPWIVGAAAALAMVVSRRRR